MRGFTVVMGGNSGATAASKTKLKSFLPSISFLFLDSSSRCSRSSMMCTCVFVFDSRRRILEFNLFLSNYKKKQHQCTFKNFFEHNILLKGFGHVM